MKLHFLYATETGSSEMLCDDIVEDLGDGFDCEITNMGEFDITAFDKDTVYMVIASTYGNGDLPATALPFWDGIEASQPDLSHVTFALFGLGDMVFAETFNNGSAQLRDKLTGLGATMIGERGLFDASTGDMPEDLGIPWAHSIIALLNEKAA